MPEQHPTDICPECGAAIIDGRSCQQIFDEFLVFEFTDSGYGRVHFLTVACFMIQHRRYSREALGWIEQKLRDFLENGLTGDEIRRQANRETQQNVRTWKVTRKGDEPELPPVAWTKRITDLVYSDHDAEGYCREIEAWGRATLRDMQAWLK